MVGKVNFDCFLIPNYIHQPSKYQINSLTNSHCVIFTFLVLS